MMKQKCRGRDDKNGNLDSVCLHCNQLSDNEDNSLPCYCATNNAVYGFDEAIKIFKENEKLKEALLLMAYDFKLRCDQTCDACPVEQCSFGGQQILDYYKKRAGLEE